MKTELGIGKVVRFFPKKSTEESSIPLNSKGFACGIITDVAKDGTASIHLFDKSITKTNVSYGKECYRTNQDQFNLAQDPWIEAPVKEDVPVKDDAPVEETVVDPSAVADVPFALEPALTSNGSEDVRDTSGTEGKVNEQFEQLSEETKSDVPEPKTRKNKHS